MLLGQLVTQILLTLTPLHDTQSDDLGPVQPPKHCLSQHVPFGRHPDFSHLGSHSR